MPTINIIGCYIRFRGFCQFAIGNMLLDLYLISNFFLRLFFHLLQFAQTEEDLPHHSRMHCFFLEEDKPKIHLYSIQTTPPVLILAADKEKRPVSRTFECYDIDPVVHTTYCYLQCKT